MDILLEGFGLLAGSYIQSWVTSRNLVQKPIMNSTQSVTDARPKDLQVRFDEVNPPDNIVVAGHAITLRYVLSVKEIESDRDWVCLYQTGMSSRKVISYRMALDATDETQCMRKDRGRRKTLFFSGDMIQPPFGSTDADLYMFEYVTQAGVCVGRSSMFRILQVNEPSSNGDFYFGSGGVCSAALAWKGDPYDAYKRNQYRQPPVYGSDASSTSTASTSSSLSSDSDFTPAAMTAYNSRDGATEDEKQQKERLEAKQQRQSGDLSVNLQLLSNNTVFAPTIVAGGASTTKRKSEEKLESRDFNEKNQDGKVWRNTSAIKKTTKKKGRKLVKQSLAMARRLAK